MRQARSGVSSLVYERVHVARMRVRAPPPRLRDEVELLALELRDRAHVPTAVHHDFVPLQSRIEVGDDPDTPLAPLRQDERLRGRHVLVAGAERTRVELFL